MNSTIMPLQPLRDWYRQLAPKAWPVSSLGLAVFVLLALASAGCDGPKASRSRYLPLTPSPYYGPMVPGSQASGDNFWPNYVPVTPSPYYGPMVPGSQASGDNFWSTPFSAGNHDPGNQRGYVSVPGVGPVGYGL
jgi:hypothetical protein